MKLDRANSHLNLLKGEIESWLQHRPYEISLDKDPETLEEICRIHIVRQPPMEWSILVGEIIYSLRSSLDHAVYALSGLGGKAPPKGTEFPIFRDEPAFRNTKRPGGLWKARGLSPAAVEVVDSVQPFRQGGGEPERHILWVLQELCNADKHRSLNLTSTALGASSLDLTAAGGVTIQRSQVRADGPVKNDAVLARWAIDVSGNGKIELEGEIGVDVAFDEAGHAKGERVVNGLIMVGSTVKTVIENFAKTL
jgi:hypothetical protein